MADILNLTLKKEVYDGILNGESDEILIERNAWWSKRLFDKDNGGFKDFKIARISSGSPDKFDFLIESIDLVDNNFVIKIINHNGDSDYEGESFEDDDKLFTENESNPESEKYESHIDNSTINYVVKNFTLKVRPNGGSDLNIYSEVRDILEDFCESKDVFVVPTPFVTIRSNGQILGTNRRLVVDRDTDAKLTLKTDECPIYDDMRYEDFLKYFKMKLDKYLEGNYVFICLNKSDWSHYASGEEVFKLSINSIKKYLIRRG